MIINSGSFDLKAYTLAEIVALVPSQHEGRIYYVSDTGATAISDGTAFYFSKGADSAAGSFAADGALEFNNKVSTAKIALPSSTTPLGDSFSIVEKRQGTAVVFGPEFDANSDRFTYRYTSGTLQHFNSSIREPGHYQFPVLDANGNEKDVEVYVLPRGVIFGDTWTPFINDAFLVRGFFQEDLSPGPVSSWPARGMVNVKGTALKTATLDGSATTANRPEKLANMEGVQFTASGPSYLVYGNTENQRTCYTRCTLHIFRVDPSSGTSSTFLTCPSAAGTGRKNRQSALLAYPTAARLDWNDRNGSNSIVKTGLWTDYTDWCFVIHWHRDGQLFASWNGETPVEAANDKFRPGRQEGLDGGDNGISLLGNSTNSATSLTFALDCVLEFPEVSEEFVSRLGWWAANRIKTTLGMAEFALPSNHKYFSVTPKLDESDFPTTHHKFIPGEWKTMWNTTNAMRTDKITHPNFSNRGSFATLTAFKSEFSDCVFLDDFREKSVQTSDSATDGIWYSLGGLAGTTVGDSTTNSETSAYYVHDAGAQTLALRSTYNGGRRSTLMGMVDGLDNGITTKGPILIQYRYRCSDGGTPKTGVWTGLWGYNNYRLKAPAQMNTEIDTPEMERWSNTAYTTSVVWRHNSNAFSGYNGRIAAEPQSTNTRNDLKFIDVNVTTAQYVINPFPETIDHFRTDGGWNEISFLINEDWMVLWVNGFEIGRIKSDRYAFLQRFHWMLQNVQRSGGTQHTTTSEWTDFIIDYVKIYKRPSDVAKTVYPFAKRPVITGSAYVGSILRAEAYCPGVKHLRYEWYHDDGYPIASVRGPNYPVSASDVGKRLRCKVVAVGHWEDGEVWSDYSSVVVTGTGSITTADLNFSTGSYTVNGTNYTTVTSLQAAVPIGFQRAGVASHHLPDDTFVKAVSKHQMRLDARGLVYEAAKALDIVANGELAGILGGSGYVSTPLSENSPLGLSTAGAFTDTVGTSAERSITIGSSNMTSGNRLSVTVLVKPGNRTWLQIYSDDDPTSFDTNHRAWFDLTGAGALGTVQTGVTASIYALTGTWAGWYLCSWSKVATATDTGGPEARAKIGFRSANNSTTETGNTATVAGYLASANSSRNAGSLTDFYHLHMVQAQPVADKLTIPLGGTPRTVTVTMVDPWTGAESDNVIAGQTGDWELPVQAHSMIKRIQIS